jgi:hypothetical protein
VNSASETASSRLTWFAIVYDHLRPIRVSLLLVAFGITATLAVDQVSELYLMATLSPSALPSYVFLLLSSTTIGLAIWYQSRNAYRLRYPRWPALDHPGAVWLRTWLPRVLGAGIPLLNAIGSLIAFSRMRIESGSGISRLWFVGCVAGLIALSGGLMAFFVGRRRMVNTARRITGRTLMETAPQAEERVDHVAGLGTEPRTIFLIALTLNVLLTVLIAMRPYWLNPFGPLAILLLAGTFLCISGGYVTMLCDRRGIPILGAMALTAVVWHWLHLNDNHLVRLHPAMHTHMRAPPEPSTAGLPRFEDYRDRWLRERCAPRQPCPLVLVAAEGGGIRAAAWTALVLAELDRRSGGRLLDRTFAASGVSGGSLGLATIAALRHDAARLSAPGGLGQRAQAFLSRDFLAPTLANMFFVDFTQRLLPGAWFDDRGRALTDAWESAYADLGADTFARPLADLYIDAAGGLDTRTPALFLSSTVVGSGRRFVQHPFDRLPGIGANGWFAANDGAGFAAGAMPLSETVLNSARFTYVSPAGTLRAGRDGRDSIQLVDGGYFENSGATTLLDVVAALRSEPRGYDLRLRVIHISNDPGVESFAPVVAGAARARDTCGSPPPPAKPRGDTSAPVAALLSTRGARGSYAREALVHALADGDRLWHFRLCEGEYVIPLGWTISTPVFDEMRRQLSERYDLQGLADEVLAADNAASTGQPGPMRKEWLAPRSGRTAGRQHPSGSITNVGGVSP